MAIREQVPASEPVTQVKFALTDPAYPFVGASAVEGCRMMLEEIIPRGDGQYAEFFSVSDADPDRIIALAEDHETATPTLLAEYDSGGLFEFEVDGSCPAVFLGEQGALPRNVDSIDGEGYVACEIPAGKDEKAIISRFLDAHPDAELVSKHRQPYVTPLFSQREFDRAVDEALTARQREVLAAAHDAGYYEWPRETTGEDLADDLGLSPATFHQHLRTAERKLINLLFDPAVMEATSEPGLQQS